MRARADLIGLALARSWSGVQPRSQIPFYLESPRIEDVFMWCIGSYSVKPWLVLGLIVAFWQGSGGCFSKPNCAHAQIYKGSKIVPGSTPGAARSSSTPTKNYFAIIGEVKYPETYELPTSAPSLIAFLKLAGGLQPSASGTIRIVRFSRSGQKIEQQLYYDERSTVTLQPGDFVVVDGKQGQGRIINGPTQSANEGDVYVGLVGVLEYPFVMQTSAQNATITWVAQQLHQKEDLIRTAKVCVAGRSSAQITADTTLPNNSLIYFEPSKVLVTQLPEGLPRPFRPGFDQRQQVFAQQPPLPSAPQAPASVAPPLVAAPNVGRERAKSPITIDETQPSQGSVALDPQRVEPPAGRVRVSDPSLSTSSPDRKPIAEPKRFQPPREASSVDVPSADDVVPNSPEFRKPFQSEVVTDEEALTNSLGRRDDSGATAELQLAPIADTETHTDEANRRPAKQMQSVEISNSGPSLALQGAGSLPKSQPIDSPLIESAKTSDLDRTFEVAVAGNDGDAELENSLNWRTICAVVIGGVGMFSLCWVGVSMLKVKPSQQIFAQPLPVRPLLDQLVNDELELCVEDIRLDPQLRIHGRPRDIGQQRVDPEHRPIARPHFMNRRSQPRVPVGSTHQVERREQTANVEPATLDHPERRTMRTEPSIREAAFTRLPPAVVESGSEVPQAVRMTENAIPEEKPVDVISETGSVAGVRSDLHASSDSLPQTRTVPKFRIDGRKETVAEQSPIAPALKLRLHGNTVKPSRVISEGSDIVDRALAAFQRGE